MPIEERRRTSSSDFKWEKLILLEYFFVFMHNFIQEERENSRKEIELCRLIFLMMHYCSLDDDIYSILNLIHSNPYEIISILV